MEYAVAPAYLEKIKALVAGKNVIKFSEVMTLNQMLCHQNTVDKGTFAAIPILMDANHQKSSVTAKEQILYLFKVFLSAGGSIEPFITYRQEVYQVIYSYREFFKQLLSHTSPLIRGSAISILAFFTRTDRQVAKWLLDHAEHEPILRLQALTIYYLSDVFSLGSQISSQDIARCKAISTVLMNTAYDPHIRTLSALSSIHFKHEDIYDKGIETIIFTVGNILDYPRQFGVEHGLRLICLNLQAIEITQAVPLYILFLNIIRKPKHAYWIIHCLLEITFSQKSIDRHGTSFQLIVLKALINNALFWKNPSAVCLLEIYRLPTTRRQLKKYIAEL